MAREVMYPVRRVTAFAIDAAAVWFTIAALPQFGIATVAVNACVYLTYRGLGGALLPATFGRWVLGLRLVSLHGGKMTVRQSLLREVPVALVLLGPLVGSMVGPAAGLFLGLIILFSLGPMLLALDLAFVLIRPDARSWRDLLAGTVVVRSEAAMMRTG